MEIRDRQDLPQPASGDASTPVPDDEFDREALELLRAALKSQIRRNALGEDA